MGKMIDILIDSPQQFLPSLCVNHSKKGGGCHSTGRTSSSALVNRALNRTHQWCPSASSAKRDHLWPLSLRKGKGKTRPAPLG